jgi:DNA-binding beta-propeller fold protein YncE
VQLDPAARRLFVADVDSVKTIDLATGARGEFSAAAGGSGPALLQAFGVALDPAHDRLFVLDESQGILTVDTKTAARALLVDPVDLLTLISLGFSLAFDAEAGQLYFSGESALGELRLFAVDVATGAARVVSDATHGSGPAFGFIDTLSITADGKTLLVADEGVTAVFLVDTATGNRTIVASVSDGLAPAITSVSGCTIAADGSFAIVTGNSPQGGLDDSCLFFLDLVSGGRQIGSSNFGGQHFGPFWAAGLGVAFDAGRFVIYVTDDDSVAVHAVDFNTGTRVVVSR